MTRSSAIVIAGLLAASVAVACTTANKGTSVPPAGVGASAGTASASRTIIREGKAPITDRAANDTFFERAKQGVKQSIPSYFSDNGLGITVSNVSLDFHAAKAKPMTTQADGAPGNPPHEAGAFESETDDSPDTPTENYADEPGEMEGVATMNVSSKGRPAHAIAVLEEDFPPMSDRRDECHYTDKTDGRTIKFSADQDFVHFTANDGKDKLHVVFNPDNTFTVNGQPAKTPQEAADLILGQDVCKHASIEALMGMYAGLSLREKAIETLTQCGRTTDRGQVGPDSPDVELILRLVLQGLQKSAV
ncbi:MAG: hypothetical protein H7338_12375 [Candidatus Sericytochromatia bacterium]|nr:hypothetical protein [Candidatus Sericytochromatia bacterium]